MTYQFMHTTNRLPDKTLGETATLLQERLTDSIDLMLHAKQARWNVKGPDFIALHKLFDRVHQEAAKFVDLIAERLVQLGGTARGHSRTTALHSSLPDHAADISSAKKHIAELAHAMSYYGELVRQAITCATQHEDPTTAEVFTEISRSTSSNLWIVEAPEQQAH